METTTKPSIYVGTYAKYNNGSIAGKWLDLDDYADAEELFKACRELHKDEADPEFMFQDFEGFPRELYGESMGMTDMEKLYEYINLEEYEKELITEFMDATGAKFEEAQEHAQDTYFCQLESGNPEREMGEYVLENGLFGVEIPDSLENYIDTEAIGRDWLMDMSVSDNGFVFSNY